MKEASTFKEILKQQIKKGDVAAVVNYDNYINLLLSIHKDSSETFNWDNFAGKPEPKLPLRLSVNQDIAEQAYKAYEPTVLDKMLGQSKKKLKDLMKNTEQAKRYDDLIYNAALKEFRAEHQNWEKIQFIAKGIKNEDPAAYQQAIEFFNPFQQLIQLGAKLRCESFSEYVIAHLNLHAEEIIPDYIVSQTEAGKVRKSQMPELKFNEICHHHVCACALRVGREIFALLPVKCVFVNAYSFLPERAGGVNEKQVILSVKFTRSELLKLNFNALSGPDHLAAFSHNMDFSVNSGFLPTQPVTN
ncbi:MAG: hypothetical protein ABWY16_09495 [Pedobacter sp.]|jgi:hypothetical protein|uniref:hypothetical protein n=1 Tax=Pedobacter sp. TaxID=1411316 RepID=UPI003392554F